MVSKPPLHTGHPLQPGYHIDTTSHEEMCDDEWSPLDEDPDWVLEDMDKQKTGKYSVSRLPQTVT